MYRAFRTILATAIAVTSLVAMPLTARAYTSTDGTDDIDDVRHAPLITASPITGSLISDPTDDGVRDDGTDADDVFRVHLKAGEWFYASMKGGDADFDLFLFTSEATSVAGSTAAVAYSEAKGTSSERFFFRAPKTGDYFLNAFAFDGRGTYTITWGKPSADQPSLTAAGSAAYVKWGGAATLSGVLSNAKGVLPAREVRLYGKTSGSKSGYKYLGATKTDANGAYVFSVKPASVMTYDVRYLGGADYLWTENVKDVKVSPYAYLTAPSVPKSVKRNKAFTSTGYLRPKHATGAYSVSVKCYLKNSKGVYKYVKTVKARNLYYTSKTTKYSARIVLPKKGAWKLVAYTAGGSDHAATSSAPRLKKAK